MSPLVFICRSLFHHWRIHSSVALGVAAATAVLTGALLVGDSMRGSLRDLTLDRLGRIDHILVTDRFFRQGLADEIASAPDFQRHFEAAMPAILLQTTLENPASGRRAAQVATIGAADAFWRLDPCRQYPKLKYDEVVLNEPLAKELGVLRPGEEILLRLARPSHIPADSPLGRKQENLAGRRMKVSAIIPAQGLGRFSLQSSQATPLLCILSLETMQARGLLYQPQKANAVIVAAGRREAAGPPAATDFLARALRPRLDDYGIRIERVRLGDAAAPRSDYINISCDQMLLPPKLAQAALDEFQQDHAQPALTYLANWIRTADGRAKIPYSTITGIDSTEQLGPLMKDDGTPLTLGGDEIALNSWAAEDMAAQGRAVSPGDRIEIVYFEPESTHGDPQERSAVFTLADVVKLAEKDEPATRATDPHFTPEVPGLTDKESIENWDPPFPYHAQRVRSTPPNNQDDLYWRAHRTTPKAFVSFSAGQRLWKSRFGWITTIRIPASQTLAEPQVARRLLKRLDPADLGFVFRPVKRQALAASQGTTAFEGLFLGFSLFIIASAVMLVALLFQLGIQQRASQIGTMLAVGLPRGLVGRMLSWEGLIVAAIGGLLGIALATGYAWLMIAALNSPQWWGKAIAAPFLRLHADNPWTFVIGLLAGVLISWPTIWWTTRRMRAVPVRDLLAGRGEALPRLAQGGGAAGRRPPKAPLAVLVAAVLLAAAIGLFVLALQLAGEAQAGAFFGGAAAVLTSALLFIWAGLRRGAARAAAGWAAWPLARLALRNAARNPGRSTLTIGLVAAATFLIVAISAFRLSPTESGTGGFDVLAETNRPIHYDLNNAQDRRTRLAIRGDDEKIFAQSQFIPLRVKGGDDASCLNLYQPQRPRILGVTPAMVEYFNDPQRTQFAWAESAAQAPQEKANPWRLLNKKFPDSPDAIPVILDKNTAMYSMHLFAGKGTGVVFEIPDDNGRVLKLRIVGLLANSVLQGSLLISEENFKRLFPQISGYRMFLARCERPPGELAAAMERALSDQGLDAVESRARLRDLLDVQNTYLSTFQSLGALGLLLGTFGLATVQLRSVLERRGELALMRAAGFRRRRLAEMVIFEHAVLLVSGLLVGLFAALLAVLPHWLAGGAEAPLRDLAAYLGIVLAVGLVSSLAAVRATLRAPLLAALRGN